ncbi:hypothetical protein Ciccas_008436 [Cichlidogyrus casuarinus]|uniref:Uncharacterized protein n=1 Tax=Cichlidogyrus casuarinus TaxID=1844966 RepID=A0ABD2Q0B2_9PLAT
MEKKKRQRGQLQWSDAAFNTGNYAKMWFPNTTAAAWRAQLIAPALTLTEFIRKRIYAVGPIRRGDDSRAEPPARMLPIAHLAAHV